MNWICGISRRDNEALYRMMDASVGGKQAGIFVSDEFSLGQYSRAPVSADQNLTPLANEDGSLHIVFAGEIYNYTELRRDLEAGGHRFRGSSSAEAVLHAYEDSGAQALGRLRGMFVFAVWNSRNKSLFIARDRLGLKPLYYCLNQGEFFFASEMRTLLKHPSVPRALNREALYHFLGFEFVPAPLSMFEHISKLPAGYALTFRNGEIKTEQYWDLSFAPPDKPPSFDEAVERIRSLLDDAVKSQLAGGRQVGAFLSGGLDSSALVAMMRRHISGALPTFTIGYPDKSFSETEYAKVVSDYFQTEHHVLRIDSVTRADIEKVLCSLDEPMTDLSTLPLYMICAKARERVDVCISGEGGDESFAGYDRFKASRFNRAYTLLPRLFRKHLISALFQRLPDQAQKKGFINVVKRFLQGSDLPADGMHLRWQYFSSPQQDAALYSEAFRAQTSMDPFSFVRFHNAKCNARDRVNREIYLDMRYMMTESVLMKVDNMSAAHALEVRVPLLDHTYVEYAASLPGNWKLKGFQTKHILRASLKGLLPDSIVFRGKQGYSLPVKNLIRDQLKDYMIELLNDSTIIRENLNLPFINSLIQEHLAMTHNHNHVLWALINVANWDHNVFRS